MELTGLVAHSKVSVEEWDGMVAGVVMKRHQHDVQVCGLRFGQETAVRRR